MESLAVTLRLGAMCSCSRSTPTVRPVRRQWSRSSLPLKPTLFRRACRSPTSGIPCREEPPAAGACPPGVRSAMLMQNHGLLASVNAIVSLAQLYRVPLLMLASYRGGFGEEHPWQTEGGGVTEDLLRALRVPYLLLEQAGEVAARLRQAQALAEASLRPVALLLCRGLMWED